MLQGLVMKAFDWLDPKLSPISANWTGWASLAGLAVGQAIFWHKFAATKGPVVKPILDWVNGSKERRGNIIVNTRREAEQFGITDEDEMVLNWSKSLVGILLHHTAGTAFAFVGWLRNLSPWTRFGLSFEIGEDILHLYQAITNTGMFETPQPVVVYVILALHHSLGLICGSVAHVFLSTWPDVQLLIPLLLSAALPASLLTPLQLFANLAEPGPFGMVAGAINVAAVFMMIWSRFFVYIPLAIRLNKKVIHDVSPGIGYALMPPLVLFGLGNVIFLLAGIAAVVESIKSQSHAKVGDKGKAEEPPPPKSQIMVASMNMHVPANFALIHGLITKRNLVEFQVAGKMVALAEHAKKEVAKKHS